MVFGLLQLVGLTTDPNSQTYPTRNSGESTRNADYRPLNPAARGKIDLTRIARHRPGILHIVGSLDAVSQVNGLVAEALSDNGHPVHRIPLPLRPDHDVEADMLAMVVVSRLDVDISHELPHPRDGELKPAVRLPVCVLGVIAAGRPAEADGVAQVWIGAVWVDADHIKGHKIALVERRSEPSPAGAVSTKLVDVRSGRLNVRPPVTDVVH